MLANYALKLTGAPSSGGRSLSKPRFTAATATSGHRELPAARPQLNAVR